MNIWDFQTRLTRRLLFWSVFSVVFSTLTFFSVNSLLRGLAIHFCVWGIIDAGIAIFGAYASAKKQAKLQADELAETKEADSRNQSGTSDGSSANAYWRNVW